MSIEEKEIPQWKKDVVENLSEKVKESKMVGLVNVEGVGAKQLQGIRDSLRGSATIQMARNTLMLRAIDASGRKGIEDLKEHVIGPVSFVFSEQDPFLLSKFLKENKAAAPAKGGQTAPKDILIPAMNTGVAPGPFISELAALSIPSRVKGGVIHVIEDTVAVKVGDVISNAMAQMLTRLGIEPMELQLKLIAAYTDGVVLTSESFDIDLEMLFKEFILGHQYAINLSVNAGYPTTDTIPLIIAKVNLEAKSLALKIGFFEQDLVNEFLLKANAEAIVLASLLADINPEAVPSNMLDQIETAARVSEADAKAEPVSDEGKDEPDEEDEDEDKEAVAGLGGLFG